MEVLNSTEITNYRKAMEAEKERITFQINYLQKDNREDEAVFEKIRLNVYNIFLSCLQVSINKLDKDRAFYDSEYTIRFKNEYLSCIDRISKPWKEKLLFAENHDITEDGIIETIKLETTAAIKLLFLQSLEGANQ
ncbi:hypothetical protein R2R35_01730 [Anaerocolumna sp. AGMB13020]|uniref:hypothetical protein n=1 Tax=Anaerocolumna sp. AGMB13020 TaxID=3081750 RepID=UPI0029529B58|nr:hypothetical protein [Anaerocolumna sp. AGMB13020]WOO37239.1 hypothetical protein R2R35_01730 [Anaerocolumna sp. AGMB13020]